MKKYKWAVVYLFLVLLFWQLGNLLNAHTEKLKAGFILSQEALSLYCYHRFGDESEKVMITIGDTQLEKKDYTMCFVPREGALYFIVSLNQCTNTQDYDDCMFLTGAAEEF
ncbi:MAG: hypothetical protein WCX97_01040 [Candidatus Magasanikbacteria bacterium]